MQRFNTVLTIATLFLGSILMVQIGETGEDIDTDGSLTAKVESKPHGANLRSRARATAGYDIVDGIYDVYAEVDGSVDKDYNSYSRGITKTAYKSRRKQHDTTGRADSMIDGWDIWNTLYVSLASPIFLKNVEISDLFDKPRECACFLQITMRNLLIFHQFCPRIRFHSERWHETCLSLKRNE